MLENFSSKTINFDKWMTISILDILIVRLNLHSLAMFAHACRDIIFFSTGPYNISANLRKTLFEHTHTRPWQLARATFV